MCAQKVCLCACARLCLPPDALQSSPSFLCPHAKPARPPPSLSLLFEACAPLSFSSCRSGVRPSNKTFQWQRTIGKQYIGAATAATAVADAAVAAVGVAASDYKHCCTTGAGGGNRRDTTNKRIKQNALSLSKKHKWTTIWIGNERYTHIAVRAPANA